MPTITLPDGKNLKFSEQVDGIEIAQKISKTLSKQALVMSVDGELKDLYFKIKKDSSVKIFTSKDPEGLDVIRHDIASHYGYGSPRTISWYTSDYWTSN